MGGLPATTAGDGQTTKVSNCSHPPLEKILIRNCSEQNKARKCRNCRIAMYNCEGVEQLCPWCYCKKDSPQLQPYDALEEQISLGG